MYIWAKPRRYGWKYEPTGAVEASRKVFSMARAGGCCVQSSAFEPSSYFGEKRARRWGSTWATPLETIKWSRKTAIIGMF